MADLSYPIGKFQMQETYSLDEIQKNIAAIDIIPDTVSAGIAGLNENQINTPYREGGWTVRQVIHHLADSHMNGYIRMKKALTEDNPEVSGYDQDAWANLADSDEVDVEVSLSLLTMLHLRWVMLMRSMDNKDYTKKYTLKERNKTYTLAQAIALYAWHGKHHVAHISGLRYIKGW